MRRMLRDVYQVLNERKPNMSLLAAITQVFDRVRKARRLAEVTVQIEKIRNEFEAKITEAQTERERLERILARTPEHLLRKELARTVEPLQAEFARHKRDLAVNPPEPVARLLKELKYLLQENVEAQDWREIDRWAPSGDDLSYRKYSAESLAEQRRDLEAKQRETGDLAVSLLSDSELKKACETIRLRPVAELQTIRVSRETSAHQWKETAA